MTARGILFPSIQLKFVNTVNKKILFLNFIPLKFAFVRCKNHRNEFFLVDFPKFHIYRVHFALTSHTYSETPFVYLYMRNERNIFSILAQNNKFSSQFFVCF